MYKRQGHARSEPSTSSPRQTQYGNTNSQRQNPPPPPPPPPPTQPQESGTESVFFGVNRTHAETDSEDDDDDVTAYRSSGGSTTHVRDHDTIKPPRMGTKNVSSKLIKHYGEMTDGGRAYDKEGSSKNKMSLRHLLKITKQAVEEHQLNDSAAYALFRNCLLYTSPSPRD